MQITSIRNQRGLSPELRESGKTTKNREYLRWSQWSYDGRGSSTAIYVDQCGLCLLVWFFKYVYIVCVCVQIACRGWRCWILLELELQVVESWCGCWKSNPGPLEGCSYHWAASPAWLVWFCNDHITYLWCNSNYSCIQTPTGNTSPTHL